MSIKDFPPLPPGEFNDPPVQDWFDKLRNRLCIDYQLSTIPASGDEIYLFDVSANATRKATQSYITTYVPTSSGWTVSGAPTVTGKYVQNGNLVMFEVKVVASTSIATVSSSSYMSLPITAAGLGGNASLTNLNLSSGVGVCAVVVSTSRVYTPTVTTTAATLTIAGTYEI